MVPYGQWSLGVAPHVGGGYFELDGDGWRRRRLRGRAHLHAARAQRVRQLRQVRQLRMRQRLPAVLTAGHRLLGLAHHALRGRHRHYRARADGAGKQIIEEAWMLRIDLVPQFLNMNCRGEADMERETLDNL